MDEVAERQWRMLEGEVAEMHARYRLMQKEGFLLCRKLREERCMQEVEVAVRG
jgi:hypothetical protein